MISIQYRFNIVAICEVSVKYIKNPDSFARLYGFTKNPNTLNYMIIISYSHLVNLCPNCGRYYMDINRKWCKECNIKQFQQNFSNWTSENEFINSFIQNIQLNAQNESQILEWIPYNRFENFEYLDKGGFSTVYKAIWLDGSIKKWSKDKENWIRYNNETVALKNLNNSSNLSEEFLNEV